MKKEALDLITLGPVARKCLGRAYLWNWEWLFNYNKIKAIGNTFPYVLQ